MELSETEEDAENLALDLLYRDAINYVAKAILKCKENDIKGGLIRKDLLNVEYLLDLIQHIAAEMDELQKEN